MSEPGGEEVNEAGGKQSKLYVQYDLMDPWAIEALAATLHRGKKYGIDNWRKIDIESHLNHAMHHIMDAMKRHTIARLAMSTSEFRPGIEDDLSHAMCRVMFALAKEIAVHGIHPEHSDPTHHEPKTTSDKRDIVREYAGGLDPVPTTLGERAVEWYTPTTPYTRRRDDPKWSPEAIDRTEAGLKTTPVHNRNWRGRPATNRRKQSLPRKNRK